MALNEVKIIQTESQSSQNVESVGKIIHVVGYSSAGPINQSSTISSKADLSTFGNGSGIEHVAEIAQESGYPVYFTRASTTTEGTPSAVTKNYAVNSAGTPVTLFGSVIIPGATNGDVLVTAKQLLVTLTVINPGALTATTVVNVVGPAITVTLKHDGTNITETGTGLAAALNGSVAAAALMSAAAQGTGAGLAGPLALTALDDGALSVTATVPVQSIRVLLSGNNTVFGVSYATNVITITLATNAIGEPTTTASVAAAGILGAFGTSYCTIASVGTGTKLLGAKSVTVLPFGSTGTMTVTGNPVDATTVRCLIKKSGTVGGVPTPSLQWSFDNGTRYSTELAIPATGIVLLKESGLDTGLRVVFTGALAAGDEFVFTTTAPIIGTTDLLAAIDVALADYTRDFGVLTSPVKITETVAVQIDSKLQDIKQNRWITGIFNVRDIAEGVPGETEDQWMDALKLEFLGYFSSKGLVSISAGDIGHNSSYTNCKYKRPLVYSVAARRGKAPLHQELGRFASGALSRVEYLTHDEFVKPGLDSARFITARTYPGNSKQFYIEKSWTMSDPNDADYSKLPWVAVTMQLDKLAKKLLQKYINDDLEISIAGDEQNGVVPGAITFAQARIIENDINPKLRDFLFSLKSDQRPSASPYPINPITNKPYQPLEILTNYSFVNTEKLIGKLRWVPKPFARMIEIYSTVASQSI